MIQHWAPMAASAMRIPFMLFITTSVTMAANMFHFYLKQDVSFLSDSKYYRKYEKKNVKEILKSSANRCKDKDRVMQGVKWWKNIVLVKSFKEIKGKYANYLSSLTIKRDVLVDPLVVDSFDVDSEQNSADKTQIALGLEMSNVNFIWVQRFLKGENNMNIKEDLPLGFAKVLKLQVYWLKVMEAMQFDVPIIAMPMHLDQPVNARLVVEIGMGKEVQDVAFWFDSNYYLNNGSYEIRCSNHRNLIHLDQLVNAWLVLEIGMGNEVVRNNKGVLMGLSDDLETKRDEEIEFVVVELLQLCQNGLKLRRICAPLQKEKSDEFIIHSWFAVETDV
ncbi:hypothetical protein Tco_1078101 [Tanacetum coccineum]